MHRREPFKPFMILGTFIIGWNVDTNDWMHTDAPDKSLKGIQQ